MQEIKVRASSLAEIFDCAMRWHAKHILKMYAPTSFRAHLGTAIHASTAEFDGAVLRGEKPNPADTVGIALDALHDMEGVVRTADDPSMREAEGFAVLLHNRYCTEIAPTRSYVAIEAPCNELPVVIDDELTIILTGTIDRIRQDWAIKDGQPVAIGCGISDLKTGTRRVAADGAVNAAADGAQLGVYELLAEQSGFPITRPAEIIGMSTSKGGLVGVATIERPSDLLIGSSDEPGLLQMAGLYLKSGIFPPNPKSGLCSAKFCPKHSTCKYHS